MAPYTWDAESPSPVLVICNVVSDTLAQLPPTAPCGARYEAVAAALRSPNGGGFDCALHEPRASNQTWITGGPPYLVVPLDDDYPPGQAISGHYEDPDPHVIVDLCFRERWTLARSTAAYDKLLRRSPAAFVGTTAQLWAILRELAREIRMVFDEHAMEVPPWRTPRGMRLVYWCRDDHRTSRGNTPGPGEAPCGARCPQSVRRAVAV
eukprot:TRINITY_DN21054_c0_g1_i1.p3 TRINITY_DN21054_c0_g1~~TRINITY_DN21054_c0_g1_i1.p3  ORF type:complete len:208 (+),score=34.25 TRINITY_DN21054_c0_g1_i1:86-709(+)